MQITMFTYFVYLLVALFALARVTEANFDMYQIHGVRTGTTWPGDELTGWKLVNNDPNCDQIDHDASWQSRKDLSHGRRGIRCDGKCGYDDVSSQLQQLVCLLRSQILTSTQPPWPDRKLVEMHFTNNPLYHFTIYKDKGHNVDGTWRWTLYGVDDKEHGECFAYGDHEWTCQWPDIKVTMNGKRKFRCLTQVDANTINFAFKSEGIMETEGNNSTAVAWEA